MIIVLVFCSQQIPLAFADHGSKPQNLFTAPITIVEPDVSTQPASGDGDCEFCDDVKATVLSMLKDSCEAELDADDASNNEMYQFLIGLNQRGVDEVVYQALIGAAKSNVDCSDAHSWVVKTKTQAASYLM